jgi:hypothetical protein
VGVSCCPRSSSKYRLWSYGTADVNLGKLLGFTEKHRRRLRCGPRPWPLRSGPIGPSVQSVLFSGIYQPSSLKQKALQWGYISAISYAGLPALPAPSCSRDVEPTRLLIEAGMGLRCLWSACLPSLLSVALAGREPNARVVSPNVPHILFILADDYGWNDIG